MSSHAGDPIHTDRCLGHAVSTEFGESPKGESGDRAGQGSRADRGRAVHAVFLGGGRGEW